MPRARSPALLCTERLWPLPVRKLPSPDFPDCQHSMHRSHLPLTKWFWAIYLAVCDKRGISALTLAGKIEVSYKTAWYLLRRIRAAMEMREERYVLQGIVEFDDSYFGAGKKGNIPGKGGRAIGNQAVFIAVSKDAKGNPAYLRMQLTPNVQSTSIEGFARSRIAFASTVQTDGFNAYRKPLAERYNHEWGSISSRR